MSAVYGFSVVSNEKEGQGTGAVESAAGCASTPGTTSFSRQRCAQRYDRIRCQHLGVSAHHALELDTRGH